MKKLKLKLNRNYWMKYLPTFLVMSLFSTQLAFAEDKSKAFQKAWNSLFAEFSVIVSGVMGIAVVTSLLVFIMQFIKLGTEAGAHPILRAKVIKDIIISGITTALLGSIGLIYTIIYQTSWFG